MEHVDPVGTADLKHIRDAVNALSEHFDSVHIFATRHESGELGGTVNVQLGNGNWFARYGQIRSWITKEEERNRIDCRSANKGEDS